MAIDLGDAFPLAVFITDDLGNPANVTTATVTVTLPDLTVATPTVTNGAVGMYTASYPTTQAGHHKVNWVGTGTSTSTFTLPVDYEDDFNVAIPGELIVSLADARAALGTAAANTVKDEDLRSYIMAATPIMENIVGPILRTTQTETYDGGGSQIHLLRTPVFSITGIIENYGSTYEQALTQQNLFDGSALSTWGYDVDLVTGIVTRRAMGIAMGFPSGRRNIQVTYVSGSGTITGDVLLATRLVIRQLWLVSGQQGLRPSMGSPGSAPSAPVGFAVPNAVYELCAPHARAPGIA